MHEGTEPDLAITLATDFIRHSEDTKFVIFSDFMSSLEALYNSLDYICCLLSSAQQP